MRDGRLAAAIHSARDRGRLGLIGYLPGGYPDPDAYLQSVAAAADSGLDILEIGVPIEDPSLASLDGQAIRSAIQVACAAGMNVDRALELGSLAVCRAGCTGLAMLYSGTLGDYGPERFLARCARVGIAGVLPVGLDLDAWLQLAQLAWQHGVEPVGFVTPDMDEAALAAVARLAGGFLYVQSRPGITGGPGSFDGELRDRLQRVQRHARPSGLPVAVGFGVQSPADVARLREMDVDAVIVGTALVEAAGDGPAAVGEFVAGLAEQAYHAER